MKRCKPALGHLYTSVNQRISRWMLLKSKTVKLPVQEDSVVNLEIRLFPERSIRNVVRAWLAYHESADRKSHPWG